MYMEKTIKIDHIKLLWTKIISLCQDLRSKYMDNLDGLKLWNNIKPMLKKIKSESSIKWNPKHNKINNRLSQLILPEKKNNKLIEKNHFFLQLLNIPKKDPSVSFSRLLQIALNLGQLLPSLDNNKFEFNIVEIYKENQLDNINTYILDDDINKYHIKQTDIDDISSILVDMVSHPPLKESSDGSLSINRYTIKYY